MYLSSISLRNFRNYESLVLNPAQETNILYGENGLGKTNVLEAVFYCAIGKSFRYSKDADLIKYGCDSFEIHADIRDDITENIDIKYSGKNEKALKVNGLYLRKLGHLMGNLVAVIFSPEDLQLVNEGPSYRRKMMDIALSQIKSAHCFDLMKYNKVLFQKNILLKDLNMSQKQGSLDLLDVYNEQLSQAGANIILRRKRFTDLINSIAKKKNSDISGGEELEIRYYTDAFVENDGVYSGDNPQKAVKDLFYNTLSQKKQREIERMQALYGPQHDDMLITLNGKDIKKFGSQGQKRTAVLSLKISELDILKEHTGRNPVLLLDDVFSELDKKRQSMLLGSIKGYQTFITCTDINEIPSLLLDNAGLFHVTGGSITSSV